MTIPAYLLTSLNQPWGKKNHLRVENLLSKDSLEFINKISELRSKWEVLEGIDFKGNKIPEWSQKIEV